jgi:hypothetical protein
MSNAITEDLVLYYPDLQIWSGTVQVRRDEDYGSAVGDLPPLELVSDGRKRLVPTAPLKSLLNVRKGVEWLLNGVGFPFMGGVAVPAAKATEVEAELPKLQQAFHEGVEELCDKLEHWYDVQENKYPEWGGILHTARLSEQRVRSRCRFDVVAIKASAPDTNPDAANRFDRFASGAFPALVTDISKRAGKLVAETFVPGKEVTQRQVNLVRDLISKLGSFAFVDARVSPMVDAMRLQIDVLPKVGPINRAEAGVLINILRVLGDPELVIENGLMAIQDSQQPVPIQTQLPDFGSSVRTTEVAVVAEEEDRVHVAPAAPHATKVPWIPSVSIGF